MGCAFHQGSFGSNETCNPLTDPTEHSLGSICLEMSLPLDLLTGKTNSMTPPRDGLGLGLESQYHQRAENPHDKYQTKLHVLLSNPSSRGT